MTREDLLAGLFPFVPGDIIKPVMQAVDAYTAAKDKEIVELKADNSGLLLVRQKLIEGIGIMDAENKRLREGLEEILRAQEYEGFLLVSPALVENLLKNPAAVENPTPVDKNNS